jgi:hypothetical protein
MPGREDATGSDLLVLCFVGSGGCLLRHCFDQPTSVINDDKAHEVSYVPVDPEE